MLFFPAAVNIIYVYEQNKINEAYDRQIQELEDTELNDLKEQAENYNKSLWEMTASGQGASSDEQGVSGNLAYSELLNVNGNQMGYVIIPKISVNLPIYHYDSEEVLSVGVGHMEYSSLPVGGESTHCVLSGHTGLPTAKIFTDLEKLEVGDRFYIKALNETLCYEVDQIKVVLPNDARDLQIEPGRDLVTLLTCTPYGLNTHRLLVRGTRIAYGGELDGETSETVSGNITEAVGAEASSASRPSQTEPTVDISRQKSELTDEAVLKFIIIPSVIALALIFVGVLILRKKKNSSGKAKSQKAGNDREA